MPNYDFKCESCGVSIMIDSNEAPPCGYCYKVMTRIWTVPGIQFKGSGFYSTGG